jgi:hypothetical protein
MDTAPMISILGGMLGLGTMRSYEKANNVPDTKIKVLGKR